MNILEDTMLVYRVAKNYYIDGYGQNEIAKMTGISRPQISRLIKRSQELGIVKIEVAMPETVNIKELEKELCKCLGISSVQIVPSGINEERDHFYPLAAKHLAQALKGSRRIGLGWGRSLYEVCRHLDYATEEENIIFYPLIGCSGNNNPYLQITSIIDRFAEKYYANACYLNLPVLRKADNFSADDDQILSSIQKEWKHLDTAVVGIGAFKGEEQFYISEVAYDPFLLENKEIVVADLLSQLFIKPEGILELPGYRHVACSIENLKNMLKVIAIAKGEAKAEAIYRVANDHYITSLITDENTAKEILKKYGFKQRVP